MFFVCLGVMLRDGVNGELGLSSGEDCFQRITVDRRYRGRTLDSDFNRVRGVDRR